MMTLELGLKSRRLIFGLHRDLDRIQKGYVLFCHFCTSRAQLYITVLCAPWQIAGVISP
jgi:hypothetical protein